MNELLGEVGTVLFFLIVDMLPPVESDDDTVGRESWEAGQGTAALSTSFWSLETLQAAYENVNTCYFTPTATNSKNACDYRTNCKFCLQAGSSVWDYAESQASTQLPVWLLAIWSLPQSLLQIHSEGYEGGAIRCSFWK